jgi:hypothetical protein
MKKQLFKGLVAAAVTGSLMFSCGGMNPIGPAFALEGQELNEAIENFGFEAPEEWYEYLSLALIFYNFGNYELAYDSIEEWYRGAEREGKPDFLSESDWSEVKGEAERLMKIVAPKVQGDMTPVDAYDAMQMAKAAYLNGDYSKTAEYLILGIAMSKMTGNRELEEILSTGLLELADELGMDRADVCSEFDIIGCE